MSLAYVLTAAAEADVRDIVRYTRIRWDDAGVRRYMDRLERGITRLVGGEGTFRHMDALYPALCMARVEHHFVFWLPHENAPALVIAIFHERMDLMTRLADRLR